MRPDRRCSDAAKLSELLDDDVWAFSNCRVGAPGRPVAAVDWFFYNAPHGTLMVSEGKGFAQRSCLPRTQAAHGPLRWTGSW